jgi:phosphoribosylanthranilate isomerase
MSRTALRIKICGITRKDDALMAADAGADAIGFIFFPSSPRYIEPGEAAEIIADLPPFVVPVGVFVNAMREDIDRAVAMSGVRCLQFHGNESPEEITGHHLPVIKAFRVGPSFSPSVLQRYRPSAYLLDTFVPGVYGGTGFSFDWENVHGAKRFGRVILSGGLRPENVREAVHRTAPYAIDVNSGVENAPGRKDREKIMALFKAVEEYHAFPRQENLC